MLAKKVTAGVISAAMAVALMPAASVVAYAADGNTSSSTTAITATGHDIYAWRESKYGTPPNGDTSNAGMHVTVTASYDKDLTLTNATAAKTSISTSGNFTGNFISTSDDGTGTMDDATVTVSGKTISVDIPVSFAIYAGTFQSKSFTVEGVTCNGSTVSWPQMSTVVRTGLQFHISQMTIGTATTPASTTITVDKSANVRSMNHILWTSNGNSILEGVGIAQTTAAHHHTFYNFTTETSATNICNNTWNTDDDNNKLSSKLAGYKVTNDGSTVTITADTAKAGEYLGIYNYDDALLQANGLKLSDHVTNLKQATADYQAELALEKQKTVTSVTVNVATANASAINKAVAKAGGSAAYVKTITLGKKVKKIGKSAFKNYAKVTTLKVKTTKLTKKSVKGSLKGSAVKTVKVPKAKKAAYKKIFKKANSGKSVTVK